MNLREFIRDRDERRDRVIAVYISYLRPSEITPERVREAIRAAGKVWAIGAGEDEDDGRPT